VDKASLVEAVAGFMGLAKSEQFSRALGRIEKGIEALICDETA